MTERMDECMHDKNGKQKDIMVDIEMIKNKYCMNNFWCVFILLCVTW